MNRQRLLILGTRGFLGRYALQAAEATGKFAVIRGDRAPDPSPSCAGAESVAVDIADDASVARAIHDSRPDLVLLLAAIADIDRCEASPELAFAINARGAESVANACARASARLLFTSTAAVFDGSKASYVEDDQPSPLSVYGKTKLWAERAVLSLLPSSIVLRFALVIGFSKDPGREAMMDTLLVRWKKSQAVFLSTEERRNPIDAATLSSLMASMIANPRLNGIYHAGALDSLSRYELGLRIAARAGVSTEFVQPQDSPIPGRAPRGRLHFLLTGKLRDACQLESETSQQAIERCFA
jgi:dTDP-4-dehydrorhamnose reductase